MSKKKYITDEKKVIISYLYNNTDWSIYKISKFLNICRDTVYTYKDFNFNVESISKPRSSVKTVAAAGVKKQISEVKIQLDIQQEQELFQKVYDECITGNRITPESMQLFIMHGTAKEHRNIRMDQFRKLPRYQGKDYRFVLDDVVYILGENFIRGNEKIVLDLNQE